MARRLVLMRRSSTPPKPAADVRQVTLHGVDYFIEWSRLAIGCSVFLPTTATKKQAFDALQPYARYLGIQLQVRNRCEYGRYGVRVWRVY
jgi:hypothetical protein